MANLIPQKSPLHFLSQLNDHNSNLTVKCDNGTDGTGYIYFLYALHNILCSVNKHWNVCPGISCQNFPSVICLRLVNLFLTNSCLDAHDISRLYEAIAQGIMPALATLDLSDNTYLGGNLSVIFSKTFPSLHTLIMNRCWLQMSDLRSLAEARREQRLPQLRHLDVSFNFYNDTFFPLLFQQDALNLITLVMRKCGSSGHVLHDHAVRTNTFYELTTLDLSLNNIRGSLFILMSHYLRHLQILVLRECNLLSDDLISLVQASNQGRLPQLRHLNISQNYVGGPVNGISRFFAELETFP